ncbi:hypothetical protein [Stieleria varia]|uniref:HTTM domain-containing protein n=1 Tax=Stieleria varia TaxID=2528005 RepID=A0A5C6AMD6_9BACT|nr:hypothetical protein [Stieleria varia]TWU00820.1 hypothetical protein Pla52n_41890 [Stieleria varia]
MTNGESDENVTTDPYAGRITAAYLIVQASLFIGLFWKLALITPSGLVWQKGFFLLADELYHRTPLLDPFFPDWLRSAEVLRWAFLCTMASLLIGIVGKFRLVRIAMAVVSLVGLSILCVHQGSYNDATFATSWWVTLWVLWLTTRMGRGDSVAVLTHAAFLARLIGSMILLGGAVGKWTPEYWSGEVFYDIYFRDRDHWLFNRLRESFEPETLRTMAMWYSRKVVVVETICGFGMWRLPPRWAAALGVTLFFSIAALSNFWLFSVLTCMVGMSSVGFLVPSQRLGETP